jgi:hypothetical protein
LDEIQETGVELSGRSFNKLTDVHQAVQDLEKKLVKGMFESMRISDADASNSLAEIYASLVTLASKLETIPKANTAENHILRRLYFNSMHSRQDTIADVEGGTFNWLLEGEYKDETSDSQSNGGSDLNGSESVKTAEDESNGMPVDSINSEDLTSLEEHTNSDTETENRTISPFDDGKSGKVSEDGTSSEGQFEDSENESLSESISRYPHELEMQQRTRQSFLTWIKSSNQVYHISGKAGSGKSTLMKFLCQHPRLHKELEAWSGDKKLAFAKFFFWNSGDKEQRSLEGLYRSLLFETLKQCPELIKEAFPVHWEEARMNPTLREGVPFLLSELKQAMNLIVGQPKFSDRRLCFFLDGLDEFEGDSTDHWELALTLQKWALSENVKICVSSRPHTEFLDVFDSNLRMQLHELTRGDIYRFTYAMFEKEPLFSGADKTFSEIVSEIVDRADGVFLWVRLVIRSLLDGIRHRSSHATLKKKLDNIPTGLDSLFDNFFNNIDPGDRERSDKMLILAASHDAVNAIMYSWLEDLDDPEFPFSAPIQAYSDDEIRIRHETVRCQLDSLSKGLLEMRKSAWSTGARSSLMASRDIYFHYEVQFFHRTVRDYLNEPMRYAEMKHRLRGFNTTEAYQRLRLAEFKFARTMDDYFKNYQTVLYDSFWGSFISAQDELPCKILDAYERVLDHHRRNPFSYPYETGDNSGVINWGFAMSFPGMVPGKDLSFLHWTARHGHHKYVMSQVLADPKLLTHHDERSLLLSASIGASHHELVCDLLKYGASPNHQITVHLKESNTTKSTTVWAVFLTFIIAHTFDIWSKYWDVRPVPSFLIMEEFLKSGANGNVYFLFKHKKDDEDNTKGGEEDILFMTLEDFVLKEQPPNIENLLRLALKGNGSWLWNGTLQALSTLTPWIRGSIDFESRYGRLDIDDLYANKPRYSLKRIYVDGYWVESEFWVQIY